MNFKKFIFADYPQKLKIADSPQTFVVCPQKLKNFLLSLQLEANNEQLEQMARDLEAEKKKTDTLLREMLPASVATGL